MNRKRKTKKINYNEISSEDNGSTSSSSNEAKIKKDIKKVKVTKKAIKDDIETNGANDSSSSFSSDTSINQKSSDKLTKSHPDSEDTKTETDEDNETKPLTKKRSVRLQVSSEEAGSDDEVPEKKIKTKRVLRKRKKGDPKKKITGRKAIKTILKSDQLKEETLDAEKKEEERLRRLQEKQETMKNQVTGEKLVLQTDPDVEIHPVYAGIMKPHQVEGVQFIWDNMIESTEQCDNSSSGGGCILAHCMGLGKTLQTIVFASTVLNCRHLKMKTVLIVTPLNTLFNWMDEFKHWCVRDLPVKTYSLQHHSDRKGRVQELTKWKKNGGVMIIGYEMFRRLAQGEGIRYKPWKQSQEAALLDPGPDIIVCDEGHRLKNSESTISSVMNRVKTRRRLVLTGTPLQNNLAEYHCMVSYVKPNLLGSLKEFRNRFVNPISNGQHLDSTMQDVALMKKRSHVLFELLRGFVQRKDYTALAKYLCEKHEYIVKVRLSKIQQQLYAKYIEDVKNRTSNMSVHGAKDTGLFADYQALMRVWTHPRVLQLHSKKRDEQQSRFIDDESEEEAVMSDEGWASNNESINKDEDTDLVNGSQPSSSNTIPLPKRRANRRTTPRNQKASGPDVPCSSTSRDDDDYDDEEEEEISSSEEESCSLSEDSSVPTKSSMMSRQNRYQLRCDGKEELFKEEKQKTSENLWYWPILSQQSSEEIERSEAGAKITVLLQILKLAQMKDDKVLVFSQSLLSLDLIEEMLSISTEKALLKMNDKDTDDSVDQIWHKNVDYFRMDGSCVNKNRQKSINDFNEVDDRRARLFLISTKAGSLGVNLVAANRVVVFDASWNPSHDIQSIFRVYRFGQTKKCFIYRLIAQGTMEEKIYERQVTKQSLSFRVVDEQQINRHFNARDRQELYQFNPAPDLKPGQVPSHDLPKDDVLADLLTSPTGVQFVSSYHCHDSLLDHQEDQELTEEERKVAWAEYNQEKKERTVAQSRSYPTPNSIPNRTFQMFTHPVTGLSNQFLPAPQIPRSDFCFLSPNDTEEIEAMKQMHSNVMMLISKADNDKRIFVDSLFALMLKTKRGMLMTARKFQTAPPISESEAYDNLKRMNAFVLNQDSLKQLARSIVDQRNADRDAFCRKLKELQTQFEWVCSKYQQYLATTAVFQTNQNIPIPINSTISSSSSSSSSSSFRHPDAASSSKTPLLQIEAVSQSSSSSPDANPVSSENLEQKVEERKKL